MATRRADVPPAVSEPRFSFGRERRVVPDRRRTSRYRLAVNIAVNGGAARTIDLSSSSVYFETDRRFRPGDELALVFPLSGCGAGAHVRCLGRVVRVAGQGPSFGIAATYEPVSFNV